MKFVLRDDDLNYFSTPEDVREWYADIFAKNIPVGFSTIPFVRPSSDVYTGTAEREEREYAVEENEKLLSYVKATPQMEILQHGTTHESRNGIFEYAQKVPRDEVRRGRMQLEKAFNTTVSIFVPPHDWINTSGIRAVEYAQMNVIRGRGAGLRNWLWRPQYLFLFLFMLIWKSIKQLQGIVPAYPRVLDFGKHKEVCSYRLEDTDVFKGLEYAYKKDGIFVVVTHLHYYTPEKKERLLALIARATVLHAEFIYPHELFAHQSAS